MCGCSTYQWNSIYFSIAKHVKFMQCLCIQDKTIKKYMVALEQIKSQYTLRGFNLKEVYADRAFEPCQTELAVMGVELKCCDTRAHVHFVERGIRFIKERIRCVRSMLPREIKRIQKRLMMELVYVTNIMTKSIRRDGGIHPVMSPQ